MIGVYILQSLKNGTYYIGSTNDIDRRLIQHEKGFVKSTRNILPVELKLFCGYDNLKLARQIEFRIKKLKRRDIIEKMIKNQKISISIDQ